MHCTAGYYTSLNESRFNFYLLVCQSAVMLNCAMKIRASLWDFHSAMILSQMPWRGHRNEAIWTHVHHYWKHKYQYTEIPVTKTFSGEAFLIITINTNRLPFTAKAELLTNGTTQQTKEVSRAKDPKKFIQVQVYTAKHHGILVPFKPLPKGYRSKCLNYSTVQNQHEENMWKSMETHWELKGSLPNIGCSLRNGFLCFQTCCRSSQSKLVGFHKENRWGQTSLLSLVLSHVKNFAFKALW